MATFRPVDLSALYTHSRNNGSPWDEKTAWGIARLPGGAQRFWGVPFSAGGAEPEASGLLVVGQADSTVAGRIPLDGTATYIMFAHICDARARTTVAGQTSDYPNPVVTAPGEHLADYVSSTRMAASTGWPCGGASKLTRCSPECRAGS